MLFNRFSFWNRTLLALTLLAGALVGGRQQSAYELRQPAVKPAGVQFAARPLPDVRVLHTATLLPNGQVLVAGGSANGADNSATNSAYLYSPATGQWTEIAGMKTARKGHFAALLQNGKVLIGGGKNANGLLATAEIFDPVTQSWSVTGSMSKARFRATATLLSQASNATGNSRNGSVLAVGGESDSATILDTAEYYDPATGIWKLTANKLFQARVAHTATLLTNGDLLVTGGYVTPFRPLTSAEIYDPLNDKWKTTDSLKTARLGHSATLLANGKVLVAGGIATNGVALDTVETFDLATRKWTAEASKMTVARAFHTASLLPNGEAFVLGGFASLQGEGSNKGETYSPTLKQWRTAGTFGDARGAHTATLLANARVLAVGGASTASLTNALATAELHDPAIGKWLTQPNSPNQPRFNHTATLLANGRVLIAGGSDANGAMKFSELYDPSTDTWTRTGDMLTSRTGHTATLLRNGKVLVTGGVQAGGAILSSAELYDPVTGAWSATANVMPNSRTDHTATLMADGRVLVTGGWNVNAGTNILKNCDIYDPTTNSWTSINGMNQARRFHTATLLFDGRLLVVGGDTTNALMTSELFDPATGRWTQQTSAMHVGHFRHTATLLPNGKVLVVSGLQSNSGSPTAYSGSANLFDPAGQGRWDSVTAPNGRDGHTATLLPNGKVLITGGYTIQSSGGGGNSINNVDVVELYDPGKGTSVPFSGTTNITFPRDNHTATLLPNGRVLIVGGRAQVTTANGSTVEVLISQVELYDVGLDALPTVAPAISALVGNGSGSAACISGVRFQGGGEAASGNANSSNANYPVVQLMRLDNEQTYFMSPDANSTQCTFKGWSNNSYASLTIPTTTPPGTNNNLLAGPAMMTVFVNGVPSSRAFIVAPGAAVGGGNVPLATLIGRIHTVADSGLQVNVELRSSTGQVRNLQSGPNGEFVFEDVPTKTADSSATDLSPSQVTEDGPTTQITVTGTGFTSNSVVLFNGQQLATTFLSSTQVRGSVPTQLIQNPGFASITVRTTVGNEIITTAPLILQITASSPATRPSITSLTPASTVVNVSPGTIAINGTNLLNGTTQVLFNGQGRDILANQSTTTRLVFAVSTSDVARAGTASVQVINAGGASNTVPFTITSAPTPTISSLSPSSTIVGTALSEITINGTNLLNANGTTQVLWNGQSRTININSSSATKLSFFPSTSDFATVGTATVRVLHTTAGVQTFSNIVSFTINAQPIPTITSLTPSSTTVPITTNNSILDLPVGVIGTNFASNAVVRINGKALTTTFVSSTRLNVNLPGVLIATETSLNFSVLNPTTNLTSNVVAFPINRTTPETVGSVLAYPLYSSTCTIGTALVCSTNTTISITNTNTQSAARVRFFFVEGLTGIASNVIRTINPNQTLTFQASEIDPSHRGYVLAVAVDNSNCPTVFNFLRGSETVTAVVNQRTYSGSVNAVPIRGIVAPSCNANSTTATLSFDGSIYDRFPSQVVADSVTTATSSNSTLLVVNAVGGNLVGNNRASNFAAPGTLLGQVVDSSLNSFSFNSNSTSSQIFTELSRAFPQTSPSFDQIIPSGQTGKLSMFAGPGLFGMTLSRNPNFNSAALLRTVAFKTPTVVIPVNTFVLTLTGEPTDSISELATNQPTEIVSADLPSNIVGVNSTANSEKTRLSSSLNALAQQQQPGGLITYTITPSGNIATGEPIIFLPQSRTVTPGSSGSVTFKQSPESTEQTVNNNFCGQTSPGLSIGGNLSLPTGYKSELIPVNFRLTNNKAPSCQLPVNVQTNSLAVSGNYIVPDDLMDDVLGLEGSYEITPTDNRFQFSSLVMGQEGEPVAQVPPLTGASLGWNFSATTANVCPSATSLTATANGETNLQICAGQPINLSVPSVPNASYTWIFPGGAMVAGRTPTINNPTPANSGTYTVQITVPSCALVQVSVQVTVNPTASANAGPDQSKAKTGETTSFTMAGSVSAGAIAVWSQVSAIGNAQANIVNSSNVATQVNITGTGTVTLQLTAASEAGCGIASDTVELTVTNQILCPTISSLSLPSARPGATISITGTNFTGATNVRFNGVQATFSVANDTTINATVPAGATSGAVSVSKTGCADATMSINILPSYEADVTPRPTGNGIITVADWVQIGLFIANPGSANPGSEFQRADCAPLATAGDGQLTMADWVQAGRFAAALDPIPAAGGQTTPASSLGASIPPRAALRNLDEPATNRRFPTTIRLLTSGRQAIVLLDSTGEENAVGFSLTFNQTKWRILTVARGADAENALFNTSNLKIAENSVGIGVALKAGQTWQPGERQLAIVTFAPLAESDEDTTELAFADFPIAREVVSEKASPLFASFKVNSVEQLNFVPSVDFGLAEMLPGHVATSRLGSYDIQRRLPPTRETRWQVMLRDGSGIEHRIHFFDVLTDQLEFQIPLEANAGVATVFIKSSTGWTGIGSLLIGQR